EALGQGQLADGVGPVLGPELGQDRQAALQFVGHRQVQDGPGRAAVLVDGRRVGSAQRLGGRQLDGGAVEDEGAPAAPGGRIGADQAVVGVGGGPVQHAGVQRRACRAVGAGVGGEGVLAGAFAVGPGGVGAAEDELGDGVVEGGVAVETLVDEQPGDDEGCVGGLGCFGVEIVQQPGRQQGAEQVPGGGVLGYSKGPALVNGQGEPVQQALLGGGLGLGGGQDHRTTPARQGPR